MKKLLFALAAVAFSTTILAQKVKIKDNLVTVDKAPYLMIEKQMLGTDVSLFNFHTNELEIAALHRSYNDISKDILIYFLEDNIHSHPLLQLR